MFSEISAVLPALLEAERQEARKGELMMADGDSNVFGIQLLDGEYIVRDGMLPDINSIGKILYKLIFFAIWIIFAVNWVIGASSSGNIPFAAIGSCICIFGVCDILIQLFKRPGGYVLTNRRVFIYEKKSQVSAYDIEEVSNVRVVWNNDGTGDIELFVHHPAVFGTQSVFIKNLKDASEVKELINSQRLKLRKAAEAPSDNIAADPAPEKPVIPEGVLKGCLLPGEYIIWSGLGNVGGGGFLAAYGKVFSIIWTVAAVLIALPIVIFSESIVGTLTALLFPVVGIGFTIHTFKISGLGHYALTNMRVMICRSGRISFELLNNISDIKVTYTGSQRGNLRICRKNSIMGGVLDFKFTDDIIGVPDPYGLRDMMLSECRKELS